MWWKKELASITAQISDSVKRESNFLEIKYKIFTLFWLTKEHNVILNNWQFIFLSTFVSCLDGNIYVEICGVVWLIQKKSGVVW